MPRTPLSPRRRRLLDAALVVTADHGLRGLTHRAVDRQAGLPEGSCSSYFRTRRSLQTALADHVSATLTEDVERLARSLARHPGDFERATVQTTKMFGRWLDQPERLQALLELTLEATRDPELGELLTALQTRLISVVHHAMLDSGREHADLDRADNLVYASYGVLVGALTRNRRDRRAYVERSLSRIFQSLSAEPH